MFSYLTSLSYCFLITLQLVQLVTGWYTPCDTLYSQFVCALYGIHRLNFKAFMAIVNIVCDCKHNYCNWKIHFPLFFVYIWFITETICTLLLFYKHIIRTLWLWPDIGSDNANSAWQIVLWMKLELVAFQVELCNLFVEFRIR